MEIEKINQYFTKSKIFLFFLISFIVGVWLSELIILDNYTQNILIIFAILMMIIFFLFIYDKLIKIIIICLLIICVGLIYSSYYKQKITPNNLPFDQNVSFVGVVISEPDVRIDKTKLTILVVDSESKELIGQKFLVTVSKYPEFSYGDKLEISGLLKKPGVFDQFDYGRYLSRYQIFAVIDRTDNVIKVSLNNANKIYSKLYKIKSNFSQSLSKILPEPESSLASGIIVGAKSDFPEDLKNDLNRTGTTHIVVISGQNMEIITSTFVNLTKYWSGGISFVIGIIGLVLFSIMTGASASVVRAAILASLFLLVRLVGRRKQIIIPLVFAGFVMILINPIILRYDLGFQLSFTAMLGLIYISPIIMNLIIKWPKIVSESLSATLGAQITTLPLILYSFGRLSILAPITNALVLTAIPVAMLFSFITGLFGLFIIPIAAPAGWVTWIILKYIIFVIQIFAKIPWASTNINFASWMVGVYYLALIFGLIIYNKSHVRKMNKKPASDSSDAEYVQR